MVKLTLDKFIERSNQIHKNKYDYSKFSYINSKVKGIIICKEHKEFLQDPNSHLRGRGCCICGHDKTGKSKRLGLSDFLKKAILKHGNIYDYTNTNYIIAHKKVLIFCNKHGGFYQTPHNHLLGNGCPKCHISKGERKIIQFFNDNKIDYIYQKTFDNCRNPKTNYKLKFDFYIPSKNLLIEYDGEQHFSQGYIGGNYFTTIKDLNELKYRDQIKQQFALKNNINFLRIKFDELKNVNQVLLSNI